MIPLTNKATFETAIAEFTEIPNPAASEGYKHPFLTIAKFVLADNKPNQNRQGIEVDDFDEVIQSAIDMPVKMNFIQRTGLQNHIGSIPIGHIKSVEKIEENGVHKLIATAALYSDEYPEEISYLKDQFEKAARGEGKFPGISYEMAFADSVTKDGNQWLKKLVTLAATFVKTPAYGSRTALLALASAGEISLTDLAKEIMALAKAEDTTGTDLTTDKGGRNVDEKELKALQEKLEAAEKERDLLRTEASTKTDTITSLEAKLADKDLTIGVLTDEKNAMLKSQLIDTRVRKLGEAGITLEADAEKATKKKEFWASLSDGDFDEYVSDLVTARKGSTSPARIALASLNSSGGVPKPETQGTAMTVDDLRSTMKGLARS